MLCVTEALATQSDARYLCRMADGGASLSVARVTAPPVRYSDELAASILDRIAKGETITGICEEPGAPHLGTWFKWLDEREELREPYARAKRVQAHAFANEIVDVSRDPLSDPARTRIQVDALKWVASRLNPKEFGESVQLKHADADGQKLDTGPRVAELLALMQPGANTQAPSEPIDITPRVLTRAPDRDTRASESDVSDLV